MTIENISCEEISSRKRRISNLAIPEINADSQNSNFDSTENDADQKEENSPIQGLAVEEVHQTGIIDSSSNCFPENRDCSNNEINCPQSNGIVSLAPATETHFVLPADNEISTPNPEIPNDQNVETENLINTCKIQRSILYVSTEKINNRQNVLNDKWNKTEVTLVIDKSEVNTIILRHPRRFMEYQQDIETAIKIRPSITQLDIQLLNWNFSDGTNRCLKAVAELQNLKSLSFSAKLLHYDNPVTEDRKTLFTQISFTTTDNSFETSDLGKIIKCCKHLNSLVITDDTFPTDKVIPEYFLTTIAQCAKLQVLHLKNIPTLGKGVSLPIIFQRCVKLSKVSIENLGNLEQVIKISSLEDSIRYLKECQDLKLSLRICLTNNLITKICQCEKLEFLSLEQMEMTKSDAEHLGKSIPQLPNLRHLSLNFVGSWLFFRNFNSVMSELKTNRSEFAYSLKNDVEEFS